MGQEGVRRRHRISLAEDQQRARGAPVIGTRRASYREMVSARIILTNEVASRTICKTYTMRNAVTRRVLVVVATLAFLTVSTAALAHGHPSEKSVDETHCAMCMAVHTATHAVAASIATVCFAAVQTAFLVPSSSSTFALVQSLLTQGRAPPQL
jgi:hypothetical protein